MDKKFYESIDEVEQLLKDNEINENAIVQALVFSNDIFPSEDDARLYAREHGFNVEEVTAGDNVRVITQLDASEFTADSFTTLKIATGLEAIVAVLKQDAIEGGNDVYFSLRNEENKSIKLTENLPHIIELARVVSGYHASYGKVELTKDMLKSFEHNFNEGVVGVDLMIDYDHEQRGAAGWVKSVFTSYDGSVLFGAVNWTPKGALALSDREFRYFSPEFTSNYVHPHTGVAHGHTLLGGGLVNRPFLKMDAIVACSEKNNLNDEVIMTIELKEHNAIKLGLETELSESKALAETAKVTIAGQKEELVKLSEENETLKNEKLETEKKAKHEKLFSENKISAAQLTALNEGKDLYEVLSLGEHMNVEPKGETGSEEITIELSDADAAACKALGINKEDYAKYNS